MWSQLSPTEAFGAITTPAQTMCPSNFFWCLYIVRATPSAHSTVWERAGLPQKRVHGRRRTRDEHSAQAYRTILRSIAEGSVLRGRGGYARMLLVIGQGVVAPNKHLRAPKPQSLICRASHGVENVEMHLLRPNTVKARDGFPLSPRAFGSSSKMLSQPSCQNVLRPSNVRINQPEGITALRAYIAENDYRLFYRHA